MAWLVAVIAASVRMAPLESVTVPRMVPRRPCADAVNEDAAVSKSASNARLASVDRFKMNVPRVNTYDAV